MTFEYESKKYKNKNHIKKGLPDGSLEFIQIVSHKYVALKNKTNIYSHCSLFILIRFRS